MKLFFTTILVLYLIVSQAQEFRNATRVTGSGSEFINDLVVDASGNS